NRFWTGAGQSVVWTDPAGQEHRLWLPYLRVPRKGVIHPDGSKESNLYHPGWLALLSLLSARHWDQVLREEARAIMQEEGRDGNSDELKIAKAASETFQPSRGRSAPAVGADPHRQAGADMPPISRDKGIQGNKTRPAVEPPIEERIDDVDDMETILATKEPV